MVYPRLNPPQEALALQLDPRVDYAAGGNGAVSIAQSRRGGTEIQPRKADRKEETMRSSLTRALVGATAVVSIAAGSLMGAGAGFAAARPSARAAVVSPYVSPARWTTSA